jgi:hypothetical protein
VPAPSPFLLLGRLARTLKTVHTDDLETSGVLTGNLDFADVPNVDPSAEVDPHWLELRGDSLLPSLYMPAPMAGRHSSLMRMVASALIGVFMLATTLGICLTYGPPT